MTQPITPQEVRDAQWDNIPDLVFKVVNALLVRAMSPASKRAVIRQDDITAAIRAHDTYACMRPQPNIYVEHWLDFEDHYRKAGWNVEYDKPGFNENYPSTFTFTAAE